MSFLFLDAQRWSDRGLVDIHKSDYRQGRGMTSECEVESKVSDIKLCISLHKCHGEMNLVSYLIGNRQIFYTLTY